MGEHPVSHPRLRHGRPRLRRAAAGRGEGQGGLQDDWLRRAGRQGRHGQPWRELHRRRRAGGPRRARGGRHARGDLRLLARRGVRLRRHLRAHPARRPPDARHLLHGGVRPRDSALHPRGLHGGARVHHLPRHHRGADPAHPGGGVGPQVRRGLLPGLLSRARGSWQPRLQDQEHAQGGGRRRRGGARAHQRGLRGGARGGA